MFLLLIIFLPLIGSFFSGLFGFYIGYKGSIVITILNTFLTFLFSLITFFTLINNSMNYHIILFEWINSGCFYCNWGFFFDSLTLIMLLVVTIISTIVHLYSSEYMSEDPSLSRFMCYLSLFTFFMIILITGDNYVQIFVGWEGVGFCSFLLINFWFTRIQANKSAMKAMLVNRISDCIFILGLLILYTHLKSVEYHSIFASINLIKNFEFYFLNDFYLAIDLICILFFIGAMGKSAQIGLHTWLPDAMEGPTPVSALIHAATMVTAGVYLVSRSSPIFEHSDFVLNMMLIIGSLTALFGGSVAIFQNDIKKIIAYSTCSQLGYMVFACGLSNYSVAIFHLYNHAFFKALLFLTSGFIIHAMDDEQDIRKMGGLRKILPFTYISFLIGSLALMGFPFLTGFYSKDIILELAFSSYKSTGHFAYWLGILAAGCTAFYSMKSLYLVFLKNTNAHKNIIQNAHEPSYAMFISLNILIFGSLFLGYLSKDMFIGLGTDFWGNSLYTNPKNIYMIDSEFLSSFIKLLAVFFSLSSLIFSFYIYNYKFKYFFKLKTTSLGLKILNFLNKKWYFDKIYLEFLLQSFIKNSYNITYKNLDKGFIELFGPKGLINILFNKSFNIIKLQTGYIFNYSFIIFLSILFLIFFLFINLTFSNISLFFIFFFIVFLF